MANEITIMQANAKLRFMKLFHPDYSNGRHFAQFKDK